MIATSLLLFLLADSGVLEATDSASPPPARVDRASDPQLGEGFRKYSYSVEVKLNRAIGTTESGSVLSHNLWLTQIQGGVMLSDVLAGKHWWGGNVEGFAQLMAGGQDHPEAAYFAGLNGGLRYHFRTGTLVDPFITGAVG